jgi:hypothetical protein
MAEFNDGTRYPSTIVLCINGGYESVATPASEKTLYLVRRSPIIRQRTDSL